MGRKEKQIAAINAKANDAKNLVVTDILLSDETKKEEIERLEVLRQREVNAIKNMLF